VKQGKKRASLECCGLAQRFLRAEGRSPNTLRLYGHAVTFFSRWLESQGRTAALDELNRAAIREWLAVLSDTHEPGTVKVRYQASSGPADTPSPALRQ
jgi:site-specific recombinase XerD